MAIGPSWKGGWVGSSELPPPSPPLLTAIGPMRGSCVAHLSAIGAH